MSLLGCKGFQLCESLEIDSVPGTRQWGEVMSTGDCSGRDMRSHALLANDVTHCVQYVHQIASQIAA